MNRRWSNYSSRPTTSRKIQQVQVNSANVEQIIKSWLRESLAVRIDYIQSDRVDSLEEEFSDVEEAPARISDPDSFEDDIPLSHFSCLTDFEASQTIAQHCNSNIYKKRFAVILVSLLESKENSLMSLPLSRAYLMNLSPVAKNIIKLERIPQLTKC